MDEDGTSTSNPNLPDPKKTVQLSPADNTLTVISTPDEPNPSSTSTQQRSNTSEITIMNSNDGKKENVVKDVSPETGHHQNSQRNRLLLLFLLLIGFFLSTCLDLLKNAISLPPWMSSIVPFLVIAFIALLMVVEAIKTYVPVNTEERRSFLMHSALSAGTISLLTILGSFLIVEEANLKKEKEELMKEQDAFNTQREGQLTQLRMQLLPRGNTGLSDTRPLENSLSNQLGIPVSSVVGQTYEDTINALGSKNVEVAWLGPFSYLRAHQKYGAKAVLIPLTKEHQKTYQSYIIANAKENIRVIDDLKGKRLRFALVDQYSASGRVIPLYELKKAGLDPYNDIISFYAGTHEKSLEQVLNGEAPAGAVGSHIYNTALEKGQFHKDDLIILNIENNIDIPLGPIAVRKDIQRYDVLRIEDAFLAIEESDPAILNTMDKGGFAKITHKSYEFLLPILNELHINLSETKE